MKKKAPKRKKRLIILAIATGVLLILAVTAVEYTSHSGFCASCHYMKPFFESWETSSHSEFECSVCHYPPGGGIRSKLRKKIEGLVMVGRYWTKLYVKSKPWAEIRDDSCLREGCHEKRLLEGQVGFHKVTFDHKIHFADLKRGKSLQCTSCHSQIVQGEHITVTQSSCFICHFKESEHFPQIKDCSHCHTQETLVNKETSRYDHSMVFRMGYDCEKCHTNTIIGDGAVPRENCYKCHGERERLDKYADTDLMHTSHIAESKIECNQCHLEIQHKIIKDIAALADCQSCHLDTHRAQIALVAGKEGRGITHALPNVMADKGISCKGCHIFHEEKGGKLIKSETLTSEPAACEACHKKGFAQLLKNWEISTEKKLAKIRSIYSRVEREVLQSRKDLREKAQIQLDNATFNLEIVEKGKSVHNVAFSQELITAAYNNLLEALNITGASYTPPELALLPEEILSPCFNCHTGIEEISNPIFGFEFSHEKHLINRKIPCSTCHSNTETHGKFIATKKTCADCHHDRSQKDCSSCHTSQKAIYQGGTWHGYEVPSDIMFEAGAGCTDCHHNPQGRVIRSGATQCLVCHEEEYREIFKEWQTSFITQRAAIYAALKKLHPSELSPQEKSDLAEIRKILENIELDGSKGIHNYQFVEETLSQILNRIKKISENTVFSEKESF